MNKEWSEKNKQFQQLVAKQASYKDAIALLIELRGELMRQIEQIFGEYPAEALCRKPFSGDEGYHTKTLAYSVWHIFRIEDITAHTLLKNDEQVFFSQGFDKSIGAEIITTGNELHGEAIAEFSKKLDMAALLNYAQRVMQSTNEIMLGLEYAQLKRKFTDSDRQRIVDSHCVSADESAAWLIDYWCGKDIRGLMKMPFSRHWIMHIEAMLRITSKLQSVRA